MVHVVAGSLGVSAIVLASAELFSVGHHLGCRAGQRFRFRPGSTFVRNFDLPPEAAGIIEARYDREASRC